MKLARESADAIDLVLSSRGAIRGYSLAWQPKEIKVREIIWAIEGVRSFRPVHLLESWVWKPQALPFASTWKRVKQQLIRDMMERTTLADLAKNRAG